MLRDFLLGHWNELKIGFKLLLEKLRSSKCDQAWLGERITVLDEKDTKEPARAPRFIDDLDDDATRRLMFEGMDDTILDDQIIHGLSDATGGKRVLPAVLQDPVRLQFQGYDSNGLGVAIDGEKRYIINKDTAVTHQLVTGQRFYAKVATNDLVVEVLTVDNFGEPGTDEYQDAVIEAKRLLSIGVSEHTVRVLFAALDQEGGRGRGNEAVDQAIAELKTINQWPYGYKE